MQGTDGGTRRARRAVLSVLLLLAVLVPLSAASSAAAASSTGCGTDRPGGTRIRAVTVDGWRRQYRLTVPRGYTGDTRVPLVVDLHGARSNAVQETLLTHMREQAGRRGWVV